MQKKKKEKEENLNSWFFMKLEKPYLKLEKSYFKEPIVGPFGPKTPKRKFLTKNPALSLFKLD